MHTIPNQVDIVPLCCIFPENVQVTRLCVLLRDLAEKHYTIVVALPRVDARWRSASRQTKQYTHTDETGKTTSDRTRREFFFFCVTNYTLCKKKKITLYKNTHKMG